MKDINHINYIKGDATAPVGNGMKVIVHICNDVGAWGAGFVLAISKKWKAPEEHYRALKTYTLGDAHFVQVEPDIIVVNMIAQHDIRPDAQGKPPIRYTQLLRALIKVDEYCWMKSAKTPHSIHMPRIGCGLAGGRWELIEENIQMAIECPVTVYDFE